MVSSAMRPLLGRPMRSVLRGTGLGSFFTAGTAHGDQAACRARPDCSRGLVIGRCHRGVNHAYGRRRLKTCVLKHAPAAANARHRAARCSGCAFTAPACTSSARLTRLHDTCI
jgi:hypothetical protein